MPLQEFGQSNSNSERGLVGFGFDRGRVGQRHSRAGHAREQADERAGGQRPVGDAGAALGRIAGDNKSRPAR